MWMCLLNHLESMRGSYSMRLSGKAEQQCIREGDARCSPCVYSLWAFL